MFVLKYSDLFQSLFALSVSFRAKQNLVCHWSNIVIKGAICRTKNHLAIQLCYSAVSCLQQVINSFHPGRLGQVQSVVITEVSTAVTLMITFKLKGLSVLRKAFVFFASASSIYYQQCGDSMYLSEILS